MVILKNSAKAFDSYLLYCSTKPIDVTFLRSLLALAEKIWNETKLLKTGCFKRNLETSKWKLKSNRSLSRW